MSLVAYDGSDSDSTEASDSEAAGSCVLLKKQPVPTEPNQELKATIFTTLPYPKEQSTNECVEDDQDSFLLKKPEDSKPKKVRIVLPSLSDYVDVEENTETERRPIVNPKSSLFTRLPAPYKKSNLSVSMVPRVLHPVLKTVNPKLIATVLPTCKTNPIPSPSQSTDVNIVSAVSSGHSPRKAKIRKLSRSVPHSDSEDEEESPEYSDELWKKVCSRKRNKPSVAAPSATITNATSPEPLTSAPEVQSTEPYYGLDNAAFQKLVGYKRRPTSVNVVDIHESNTRMGTDMTRTKVLTDPVYKTKYVPMTPVDETCKKKHHITFLAEQARVNQQDLENQWASSRQTRKQTQAKYGF